MTICWFLDWENAHALIGSKLASKFAMRWMDCVYLGICFIVIADRFDRRVLRWRAEQWFQKILVVCNSDFGMKLGDCDILIGMGVDVRALHIRLKQHIDLSPWKLQHVRSVLLLLVKVVVLLTESWGMIVIRVWVSLWCMFVSWDIPQD